MRRIEDYALIGDLQTAALVDRGGSIDWCCFPRFDSAACFAALLGGPEHGRWLIAPAGKVKRVERRYRTDTLILESVFETREGRMRAIDFMPPRGYWPDIVRIVEGLDGTVKMRSELVIRFDYGHIVPWVRRVDHARVATAGPDALVFRTPVDVRGQDMRTVGEFELEQGKRTWFTLTWFPSHQELPESVDAEQALQDTEDYWLDWAARCTHAGDYHDEIHQSLLVLKALTYAPTGGIVAAPTTSLPEQPGGPRNWDYRFCWLRDATLTLLAMLKAGYSDEAEAWRGWLRRAVAGDPADLQIMYGLGGERRLDERELEWLPGYERSSPVRVGNAASAQRQLDVYGEVLDASYQSRVGEGDVDRVGWSLVRQLLRWLEEHWREEDSGLWEVRGPTRHFTHSKVMCWVAFDRAVRICDEYGAPGAVERWRGARDEIHAEVLAKGWNEKRQAFTQYFGADELDASLLLMPLVKFLPATDPRFVSTLEAIRRELTVDGLVLRYRSREDGAVDGLPPGEGVFLPCSFWLANVLAMQGKLDEARELFERLLDLRNDVGLLSEEYEPVSGLLLGNFPQAFTHLALVETAIAISEGRGLRHMSPAPSGAPENA
ncbi:MAG: glucoamylase [Candidatus Rokuibacteriota bacterium]|nr:MAG: glucoamylase [Candidatus Rokubacteria bacterium]